MPLTHGQYIAINVASWISSPLSVLGSATLIRLILRRRSQKAPQPPLFSCYEKIVLLLSTGDLIVSCIHLCMSFAVPQGTEGAFWAVGNTTSCSLFGFASFFGSQWVAGCNCFLAIYFLMSVRYGWKDQRDFTPRKQALGFFSLCGIPTITSILAVTETALNFSSNGYICFIGDYPDGCVYNPELDCQRGQNASQVAFLYVTVMLLFSLTGFACTTALYCTIRSTTQQSLRHTRFWMSFLPEVPPSGVTQQEAESSQQQQQQSSSPSPPAPPQSLSPHQHSSLVSSITRSQEERLRQTAWQAVLYSLAYFNVFFWPFTSKLQHEVFQGLPSDRQQEPVWFVLLLLTWFFYPMQGFLNFIIFIRPDISRWRNLHPQESLLWILHQAVVRAREPSRLSSSEYAVSASDTTNYNNSHTNLQTTVAATS